MTTPKEFETKVRELFGIPLDYDLASVADDDLFDLINGHWIDSGKTWAMGIRGPFDVEEAHGIADGMTYEMLTELGYGSAVRIIENVEKWYA